MTSSTELGSLLWAQEWQVGLLILIVLLVVRFCARRRPYLAHALWLVVLLKCVTPPVWSSPGGIFCWLQTGLAAREHVAIQEASTALSPRALPRADVHVETTPVSGGHESNCESSDTQSVFAPYVTMVTWSRRWMDSLVKMWISGAVIALLFALAQWLLFLRQVA